MDKYQSTSDKIGYCIGYASLGAGVGLIIDYQFRDSLSDHSQFLLILALGAIVGVGIAVYFHILHPEKAIVNNPDRFKKYKRKEEDSRVDYRYYILFLLAEVMKMNLRNKACEIEKVKNTIKRYYPGEKNQEKALDQFHTILENSFYFETLEDICGKVKVYLSQTERAELVMELFAVAYADNDFNEYEEAKIKQIVKYLAFEDYSYPNLLAIFRSKFRDGSYNQSSYSDSGKSKQNNKKNRQNSRNSKSSSDNSNNNVRKSSSLSLKEAYNILDVAESASDAEIKKKYHTLAIQYHPDRATAFGKEAERQANESMKKINKAWEIVKETRGLK